VAATFASVIAASVVFFDAAIDRLELFLQLGRELGLSSRFRHGFDV